MIQFASLTACLLFSWTAVTATTVDILKPEDLATLDIPGQFSLATVLGAGGGESEFINDPSNESALTKLKLMRLSQFKVSGNTLFASLYSQIKADVEEIRSKSGETMAYSSEQAELLATQGNVARHFDPLWLESEFAAFPLVAVINRMDKRDFYTDTCGEVRFIYRLAYYKNDVAQSRSTLPLFLNVVYEYLKDAEGSCQALAQKWQGNVLAANGPLDKSLMNLKQIELNLQIVRFPSGQKTDFGGQAIYLFRIFQADDDKLVSIPLENTPNVGVILKDKQLQGELLAQLQNPENQKKIDEGTFVLTNSQGRLLSSRALSFSTVGRARRANKPFTMLDNNLPELHSINVSGLSYIKSREGFIERLNNQTCTGCHQSSGTAGFHMLGNTGSLNSSFNQVVLPFSPHYSGERSRRVQHVNATANGQAINSFRPHSIFPPMRAGQASLSFESAKVRDLCLPNQNHFAPGMQCEKGSHCMTNVTDKNNQLGVTIGECVADNNVTPGHVCREGVITNERIYSDLGDLYNLFGFKDTIKVDKTFAEGGNHCGNPSGGVPLGRISIACESEGNTGELKFVDQIADQLPLTAGSVPSSICAIRGGTQFDECAKTNNPPICLANAPIRRGLLDTCYEGRFCREDYICQQLPRDVSRLYSGTKKTTVHARIEKLGRLGIGFCVPNYFVFNMRADGHLIPAGH